MCHPEFPLPEYIRDEPAVRRLLAMAAQLRRRAHYSARDRDKLLAVAVRIEALCRYRPTGAQGSEAGRLAGTPAPDRGACPGNATGLPLVQRPVPELLGDDGQHAGQEAPAFLVLGGTGKGPRNCRSGRD